MQRRCLVILCLLGLVILSGCSGTADSVRELKLVSTTTLQDSGLLDVLVPAFEKETGIAVKVVAVGSGQALELARRGDTDLLLTHSPDAEKKFIQEGWGESRRLVMHNDFVILGSQRDPAQTKDAKSAAEAVSKISSSQSKFISRGDESGTHVKEKSLWKAAGITPGGEWYILAGSGMGPCLRMAHEKQAYILCDRATYLKFRTELQLIILCEGDEKLLNSYSVITLNLQKLPHVHQQEAERFADFLLSSKGQTLIEEFGKDRFGQSLFIPDAKPKP